MVGWGGGCGVVWCGVVCGWCVGGTKICPKEELTKTELANREIGQNRVSCSSADLFLCQLSCETQAVHVPCRMLNAPAVLSSDAVDV